MLQPDILEQHLAVIYTTPNMSVKEEDSNAPPPSQSHFATFTDFKPDDDAPFDDEFARLASSQQWAPGSQEYTRERTIAMNQELKLHYFSSQPKREGGTDGDGELTEEQTLEGYNDLCREVGIAPRDSIPECKRLLKSTLVNIVDLIDAWRTDKKIVVWLDFEAFRTYTLRDENRINPKLAEDEGGHLASLLQHLKCPRQRRNRGGRGGRLASTVVSGRVTKKSPV